MDVYLYIKAKETQDTTLKGAKHIGKEERVRYSEHLLHTTHTNYIGPNQFAAAFSRHRTGGSS